MSNTGIGVSSRTEQCHRTAPVRVTPPISDFRFQISDLKSEIRTTPSCWSVRPNRRGSGFAPLPCLGGRMRCCWKGCSSAPWVPFHTFLRHRVKTMGYLLANAEREREVAGKPTRGGSTRGAAARRRQAKERGGEGTRGEGTRGEGTRGEGTRGGHAENA